MNRFSFLEQDYPDLYQVCSDAMQYGLQDFSIAMLKSRQALEKIVEHFDAEGENLFSKINTLGDDGEIPKSVMKHFHTVRKIANPSVHGQEVSEEEILEALDALFEITVWLAVQKEGNRYEPELFNDRDLFLVRRYEKQTGNEGGARFGKFGGQSQGIDFEIIFDEYRRAAEAGDTEAMQNVGEMYATGKGTAQDYMKALEWYQKAANAGNTVAMIAIGKLCAGGKGVEQNFDVARQWYQAAADAGSTYGAALLGACYEKGEGIQQNYAEAFRRYQSAANAGSTIAMRNMSRLCAEGCGTVKDEKAALQWLEKAAKRGDTEAMKFLADKHFHGEWGLFKNPDEGIEWLRKASDAGDVDATIEIGRRWANFGDEAAKWFLKAVKAGSVEGMRRLGDLSLQAWWKKTVDKYYDLSSEYSEYKEFLSEYNNLKYGEYTVQKLYEHIFPSGGFNDKDNDDYGPWKQIAVRWYRKAATLGDAGAMTRLGVASVLGVGLPQDFNEGMKYLNKAVELGDTDAMRFLGLIYSDGKYVEKDEEKSLEWYRKAANMGSAFAIRSLGEIFGVSPDKAANAEDATAMFDRGKMFLKASNAEQTLRLTITATDIQNAQRAFYWFKKSAEAGNADAMYYLGWMYYKGSDVGLEFDPKKAKEWFQKAANAGNENAKQQIDKVDKGACYITTAVCGSLHQPDDCYELTMFRAFRDGWLQAQPDGNALIAEYYEIAPSIVRAIDALPNAKEIYRAIWDKHLAPCLAMLEAKNMRGCKEAYKRMVLELKEKFA